VRAEQRVDAAVVGHVVAAVGHRGGVERGQPDGVDPEVAEVGEALAYSGQVADAVSGGVGEAADVDLIDDGITPPGDIHVACHARYVGEFTRLWAALTR